MNGLVSFEDGGGVENIALYERDIRSRGQFLCGVEEVFRVRARIWKGADVATRASITAPPCLPVAPTMRSLRSAIMEFDSRRGVRLKNIITNIIIL